jgi:hypothetical protein
MFPMKKADHERLVRRLYEAQIGCLDAISQGARTWVAPTVLLHVICPTAETPSGARKVMNRVREDAAQWLRTKGLPVSYIEAFEGSQLDHLHVHAAWAVPQKHAKAFRETYAELVIHHGKPLKRPKKAVHWGGRYHVVSGWSVLGWVSYFCKGAVPDGEVIEGVCAAKDGKNGVILPVKGQKIIPKFEMMGASPRLNTLALLEAMSRGVSVDNDESYGIMAEYFKTSGIDLKALMKNIREAQKNSRRRG